MDQIDFSAVAAQVAHPSGEDGVRTAQRMNRSNGDMTRHAVDLLNCQDGQFVLEIGPGNGLFAAYVLSKAKGISYAGTDISDTMIAEGERINRHLVESGHRIGFHKTDGLVLPYGDDLFDRVFTVNTIYFWSDPTQMLGEIRRVLKPGGRCCLAFASREFMASMPFTDGRFTLYDQQEVETLLKNNGFQLDGTDRRTHETTISDNSGLMRDEIFVMATPSDTSVE